MIHTEEFYSEVFEENRTIHIYLPDDYENEENHQWLYPVAYMQDGQNLFSHSENIKPGSWNLDHTLSAMIDTGIIEPIIVIGISHSDFREDEYTPSFDEIEESGGLADRYLDFLTLDLMPYIESKFPVSPFKEQTAICGSSLGGLLALYGGIKYPDSFSMIGALSPSLWWDDGIIYDILENEPLDPSKTKLWLDMGHFETDEEDGEENDPIEESRVLEDMLYKIGFKENENFCYFEDEEGSHDELSWGKRMIHVLEFFFAIPETEYFQ